MAAPNPTPLSAPLTEGTRKSPGMIADLTIASLPVASSSTSAASRRRRSASVKGCAGVLR
jgi:hypothetical protein